MPGTHFDSDQRLSLILETQQAIAAAGDDLESVMQVVAERSPAIIGADGAMVNLIQGEFLHTRAASGSAAEVRGARRPIAKSIARYAIESGQPLLVEDTRTDPRINQEMRGRVGDTSLICVPLFSGPDVIGTLNVMSGSETEHLDEDDRKTLEMLSVVLSAGVSRVAEFEARRAQAQAIARFRTLFDGTSLGILRLDAEGVAVEVNPALEQMLGATANELVGSRFSAHLIAEHRQTVDALLAETVAGERESFALEARCTTKTGGSLWAHVRAVAEQHEDDAPLRVVAMIENITERKRAEQELIRQAQLNEHQALHDPLTGLPNRLLFGERIGQAIRHAERNKSKLAVVLMDLDRFKEVNDSLGHSAGDHLLVKVGERMRDAVRGSDTVARLGGDEFGLLLPELVDGDGAVPVITRIRAALERPVYVHSLPLAVEASIGIAIYPDHGTDAQSLIQKADVAMYDSKRDSASHTFYDEGSHEYDVTRLTLVAELRRAIASRELILHYQPKAALESGEVRSVEALLRWVHPERGMVFPDSFIPIAQETGLIGPLTLYVIEEALRQGRAMARLGHGPVDLGQPVHAQPAGPGLPQPGGGVAQALGDGARVAGARGHRVLHAGQPDPGQDRPRRAPRARPAPLHRRFRHRLLLAVLPAPAPGRRDQDRPLLRHGDGRAGRRRRDRALHCGSRPQPRPRGRRRGGRDTGPVEPPARARLQHRPGLLPLQAGAGGGADRLAAGATRRPAGRRRGLASRT